MHAFLTSGCRAIRSLFAPGMLSIFILSVLTTIAVLGGFIIFVTTLFAHMQGTAYVPWLGALGAIFIAWLLFPGILPVIVSFFDNRIADIIEQRDYPGTPTHMPEFWPEMLHDARFSTVMIVLNILVLPLYFFPMLMPFIFFGLNGYLLGREFFVMAARRHIPAQDAEALRKRYGKTVWIAGVAITLLATVPIVNLFAPFWGIALMVHLYHRLT